MKQLLHNRRWLLAIVAVAVIAGLTFGGIALASAIKSTTPTPTPWPSPPEYKYPTPYEGTVEEENAARERALEENRENGGFEYSTSGPSTMGSTISVAGKMIKLPDDAYVEYWVVFIECSVGTSCPQTPFYIIARGDSRLAVEQISGKILNEEIASNEEGAFNFLKEALR
ncbi:MAG: hypothetical protein FJ004_02600 [Chloroflexi bacterium]|nr:hypothetical protein [Chloroflexota bacterium]